MAKAKEPLPRETPSEKSDGAAHDPHAVLRHPASPPRPNAVAFLIALVLFFVWFAYLVYVAWRG